MLRRWRKAYGIVINKFIEQDKGKVKWKENQM